MNTSTNIPILPVSEIFVKGAPKYVIPIYQRSYAWGKVEIDQLLDDILSKKEQEDYYLGNLIVSKKDDGSYEVIDGQQRLTTLYILCKYLEIDVCDECLTFQIREAFNNTLKNLSALSENLGTVTEKNYSEEILYGYKIIKEYIVRGNTSESIKNRLNHVKLLRIEVPVGTDLNHYFEVMNTRGEQLKAQDIIKARMMSVLETDKDKQLFSMIWDACSDMDCYVQMNFIPKTRENIFGKTLNEFGHNGYEDLAKIINSTTESKLSTLKDILENKSEPNNNTETESNGDSSDGSDTRFESIIEFPYFLIHINKLVRGTNESLDDKELLNIYKSDNYYTNPKNVRFFIFHLLKYRFLFDKFILKRNYEKEKFEGDWSLKKMYRIDKDKNLSYKGTFGDETDGVSSVNRKIRTLQSALRITYTSPKAMAWITEFLRDSDSLSDSNGKSFLDKIERYCRDKVRVALDNFDKTEEKNAYRDMERIVYTYLDYILWRDGYQEDGVDDIKPTSDWKFLFRNSLEHFYPQTSDKKEGHEPLESVFLHNFGNLCLVDVSANAHFSNLEPKAKIEHCKNTIEQCLKLKIMAKIAGTTGWDSSAIKKHEKKMLTLLYTDIDKSETVTKSV